MRTYLATSRRLTALAIAAPLTLAPLATHEAAAATTQVNAGGLVRLKAIDAMSDTGVDGWSADDGYDNGDPSTLDSVSTAGVANAAPAGVYETSRYGKKFSYTLRDLKPGASYTIRTHMVEDYWSAKGQRVMNITANGATAVSNLDLVAAAGPRKPVVRQFTATATSAGRIVVTFSAVKDNAVLSGIEVLRGGTATAPVAPANVSAKAISTTSVLVDWKADVEASQYTVYRDGRRLATTTTPAYLDQSVAPGSTHTYRVTATGPSFRVSGPSATVSATAPTKAGTAGRYSVADGVITDPNGRVFVPVGANLGTPSTASGRGVADGHAKEAKAWGWNAVRLTFYTTDEFSWTYRAQHGYPALLEEVRKVVKEYRDQGIVVVIDGHDTPEEAANPAATFDQMNQFWGDVATMYKGDSGVWFNLINEPKTNNDAWYDVHARFLATIRSKGNQNIAVVDTPVWGQDLGGMPVWFPGTRHSYDASMAPRLAAHYGDVVVSQHNYGAYDAFTTEAAYTAYTKKVQGTGLALITGETGYTIDGSTTAGSYDLNKAAALATFAANPKNKVGTFVWNATHNDKYSVKADGSAFFAGATPGANLSDMGRRLWALTH